MRDWYAWHWASRAAHDAAGRLGLGGAVVTTIAGPVVAILAIANTRPDLIQSYVDAAVFGLIGLAAAFGLVFFLFLLAAPQRMAREAATKARDRESALVQDMSSAVNERNAVNVEADGLRQKLADAVQIDKRKTFYRGEDIHIADLVRDIEPTIIRDRTFEACKIYGPAVISAQDLTLMDRNDWDGPPESLLFEVAAPRAVTGIIMFERCTFRRCTFRNVAVAGDRPTLELWLQKSHARFTDESGRGVYRTYPEWRKRLGKEAYMGSWRVLDAGAEMQLKTGDLDVRDFGAVGDGATDDTDAMQAALDKAQEGESVSLAPGVYVVTRTLVLRTSGVAIRGLNAQIASNLPELLHIESADRARIVGWVRQPATSAAR